MKIASSWITECITHLACRLEKSYVNTMSKIQKKKKNQTV